MTDPRSHSDREATPDVSGPLPTGATPPRDGRTDRRTLLKRGLLAGTALAAGGGAISALTSGRGGSIPALAGIATPIARKGRASQSSQPNILVIVVDQLRSPSWFPPNARLAALTPNLARLRRESVSLARHYTVSNDCTPARAAMVTGLYTHQTGALITGGTTLDPAFPTYGTMLRDHGYLTNWYGKWHLTHGDNHWTTADTGALEAYGFSGGTFPSPDGGPGQGWHTDPHVSRQFGHWFAQAADQGPWCTTVSFVNPHDIAWWYRWSDQVPTEAAAPRVFSRLPPNFETPEQLRAANKPTLQLSLQQTAAASFGDVPFHGSGVAAAWLPMLDLYLKLQRDVDQQIGRVLDTLARRPDIAANTIVMFTSDHGEYGSSHGLRGKGAGVYEEAIRVPLMVKDPRGVLTREVGRTRAQLSSSVDLAPLLLTIARGSNAWRGESSYAHLARRADLASVLRDPSAPGRPYVLHATDEIVTEFALSPYAAAAPLHVTAIRTPTAKYATYSHWAPGTMEPQTTGQDRELYDYTTHAGRLELDNGAGKSALEGTLDAQLQDAIANELREPLPAQLRPAQQRGYLDYRFVSGRAADSAELHRALAQATRRPDRHLRPGAPLGRLGPHRPPRPPRQTPPALPPEALAAGRHPRGPVRRARLTRFRPS